MTAHLWFDAEHTHAAAGVFLLTKDDRLVLQLRDDIPNIDNPGMITTFGGQAEPNETAIDCALREIAEETGLQADPSDLRYLGSVSKRDWRGNMTACVFFVLADIDSSALVITEGTAVTLSRVEVVDDPRLTLTCRAMAAKIEIFGDLV
ncbi:MAG TPA: NUDIX domain-containing protein [Dongiaceae bacterium]